MESNKRKIRIHGVPTEYDLHRISYNTRFRSAELPIIKRQRHEFLKLLLGRDIFADSTYFEFTTAEFIVFSTLQHANLNHLIMFLNMCHKFGSMATGTIFLSFQLLFGMPLFMLYLFLASYTKRSFFSIWECTPIIEGFGYALAIAKLLYDVHNITLACYLLEILMEFVTRYNNMNFEECLAEGLNQVCLNKSEFTQLNCSNTTRALVGAQFYFRRKMLQFNEFSDELHINLSHVVVLTGLWLLVFILCIFGTERISRILYRSTVISVAIICAISIYVVCSSHSYPKSPSIPPRPYRSFNFWINAVLYSNTPPAIAQTLWLGTLLPKQFSPKSAALVLASTKTAVCLILMCFTSFIFHEILYKYKFNDPDCFVFDGIDLFVVFVPEILVELHFGLPIALLWCTSLTVTTLVNGILCSLAIVDSLCDSKPALNPKRLVLYTATCGLGFLMSLPYTLSVGYALLSIFGEKGLLILKATVLVLVTLTFLFLYSITRITEDFTFTYGSPPPAFFVLLWKTTPIITIFTFILMVYEVNTGEAEHSYKDIKYISIASYIVLAISISPIIIVVFMRIFKQLKYHSLKILLRPPSTWGPYDGDVHNARKLFFPQREISYRNMSLRCPHNCLAGTNAYMQEHDRQMLMLHRFARKEKDKLDPSLLQFIMSQQHL